jgi:hypothetical protein
MTRALVRRLSLGVVVAILLLVPSIGLTSPTRGPDPQGAQGVPPPERALPWPATVARGSIGGDGTGCLPTAARASCPAAVSSPTFGPGWTGLNRTPAPSAREFFMMAYDDFDHELVLFGGYPATGGHTWLGDTWTFANGTWKPLNLSISPPARSGGGLAYDPSESALILFGGVTDTANFNDTWAFHANRWLEEFPSTSPAPRYRFGMATDAGDSGVLIFGGCGPTGCQNAGETWIHQHGDWRELQPHQRPAPRIDEALSSVPDGGAVLMFGGCGIPESACSLNDTWEFDRGQWTLLSYASHPGGRELAAMAPMTGGTLILFGGASGTHDDGDTWLFHGGRWVNATMFLPGPPAPASAQGMVWDPSVGGGVFVEEGGATETSWAIAP